MFFDFGVFLGNKNYEIDEQKLIEPGFSHAWFRKEGRRGVFGGYCASQEIRVYTFYN